MKYTIFLSLLCMVANSLGDAQLPGLLAPHGVAHAAAHVAGHHAAAHVAGHHAAAHVAGHHAAAHHAAAHHAVGHHVAAHALGHHAAAHHAVGHHAAAHHAAAHHVIGHHPVGHYAPVHHGHHGHHLAIPVYNFDYAVHDDYLGTNFGHVENREGYNTQGQYFVNLPDGRIQTVTYYADEHGYHPTVTYTDGGHVHVPVHAHAVPLGHGYHG